MRTPVLRVLELRSVRGTGGGPEKTILLGAARSSPDIKVDVCYLRDDRDGVFHIDARAAAAGVDYHEIHERHSFDPRVWPELRALVRATGASIVHAHDYKTDLLALLLERTDGVAALATAHGWTGNSARERLLYYPADKRLLRRFRHVIAVSGAIRRELVAAGARPDSVTVVLNGIDPDAFRRDRRREASERQRLGVPAGATVIGAVGRLERQKRFDALVDAFARLRRERRDLHLLIAGDGALRPDLERRIAARGVGEWCRLVGHLPDVRPFHHALDLFVQSSDYEGTSNAILEAMALETPIVATDAGGTSEQIETGVHGVIVPVGDFTALEAAIADALTDRTGAARRAAAARSRVESVLSFAARTERVENIYRQITRLQNARVAAAVPEAASSRIAP